MLSKYVASWFALPNSRPPWLCFQVVKYRDKQTNASSTVLVPRQCPTQDPGLDHLGFFFVD